MLLHPDVAGLVAGELAVPADVADLAETEGQASKADLAYGATGWNKVEVVLLKSPTVGKSSNSS